MPRKLTKPPTFYLRHCSLADDHHRRDKRVFAHVHHYPDHPDIICVCKAFKKLKKRNKSGIIWHEIGHLYATSTSKKDPEILADITAEKVFGKRIYYDKNKIQWI